MPLTFLGGVLLLRRRPLGYLLASVVVFPLFVVDNSAILFHLLN